MPHIRKAQVRDVPQMITLINEFAERGLMLHRAMAEMYDQLRNFQVAEYEGELVGVAGLRIMWSNLAEVYGLAVADRAQGKGVGKKLVLGCVDEAEVLGIHRVFSLTYEQQFFERCHFAVVDRHTLPLKVWSECIRCPKHDCCDEIAMVRELENVPDLTPAVESNQAEGHYTVPVTIESLRPKTNRDE